MQTKICRVICCKFFAVGALAAGWMMTSSLAASAQVIAPAPQAVAPLAPVAAYAPVPEAAPVLAPAPALPAPPACPCPAPPVVTYSPPVVTYSPPVVTYPPVVRTYSPVVTTYNPVVTYSPVVYGRPAVVRTKVYYPGQPVRNFFRAVTP